MHTHIYMYSYVAVETASRPSFHAELNPSLSQIGRALAGGNLAAISRAIFACESLRDVILQKVTSIIDAELMHLCKRNANPPSLFRRVPIDALPEFRWCNCIAELKLKVPTLLQLVSALVSKNDSRNKQKHGEVHHPGICMAIAVMLKERNREMCGIQTLLSVILFSSRVQKQVSNNEWFVHAILNVHLHVNVYAGLCPT